MEKRERIENTFNIELKEGQVHIVYGYHQTQQRFPETLNSLIRTSDAVVLEGVSALEDPRNYLNSPHDALIAISSSKQHGKTFLERKKTGKPLYILDAELEFENEEQLNNFIEKAELILGFAICGSISAAETIKVWQQRKNEKKGEKTPENVKKTSRRNILLGLAGAGTGWVMTSSIANTFGYFAYETGLLHGPAAEFDKFSQKIHPEVNKKAVKYRNLLWAYKLIKLLEHEKIHDLTMIVGHGHVGIEDILIDYQEGKLSLADMAAALREINATIHSPVFHTVGKYSFDKTKNQWNVGHFEIPELK